MLAVLGASLVPRERDHVRFITRRLPVEVANALARVASSESPTIPTILTTRCSLPLSASRRTKRMLSQKERVDTEGLAWRLHCKEKNAPIERARRKEPLGYALLPETNVGCLH